LIKCWKLTPLIAIFSIGTWGFGSVPKAPQIPKPASVFPMLATDPLTAPVVPKPGDIRYTVNVKFTNHGVKDIPAETIPRLIHAVEVIYSQCPGVDFHVNVVSQEMAPYTTDQDNVTEILNNRVAVGDGFQKFYSQFPNSPQTGIISVDLVDDLSANIRRSEKPTETYLGQALPATILDNLYLDTRSPQHRGSLPSAIGGNTIRLAMKTFKIAESVKGSSLHINEVDQNDNPILDSKGKPIPVVAFRGFQSALLAHEIGHILMDPQSGRGVYIDHYCQDLGVTCPEGYLMSGGGFTNKTFLRVPEMDRPIGYSPLPVVERGQCETMIHNPLVKAEN